MISHQVKNDTAMARILDSRSNLLTTAPTNEATSACCHAHKDNACLKEKRP